MSGCSRQSDEDHSEKTAPGKVILLFYHRTLPNHDALAAVIRERPALRGLTIHQVALPLVPDEEIRREMKAAIDKHAPDIYFTYTSSSFRALKSLNTDKKPVVFLTVRDLSEMEFADQTGKRLPGMEHATGLLLYTPAHPKHLETLLSAFPRTRRVGVLIDDTFDASTIADALRGVGNAEAVFVRTTRSEAVEDLFARITAANADAWYFPQTAYLQDNYKTLIPKLRQARVRGLYGWHFGTMNGGTLAMQATIPDRHKRTAEQIELILSGTPPSQIAIETASVLRLSGHVEALRELGDGFDARMLRYMDFIH